MNEYEQNRELEKTRDNGYSHTEYIVWSDKLGEPLVYDEKDYDIAQDVYFDACEVANKSESEASDEIRLIQRDYFNGIAQDRELLSNI